MDDNEYDDYLKNYKATTIPGALYIPWPETPPIYLAKDPIDYIWKSQQRRKPKIQRLKEWLRLQQCRIKVWYRRWYNGRTSNI